MKSQLGRDNFLKEFMVEFCAVFILHSFIRHSGKGRILRSKM